MDCKKFRYSAQISITTYFLSIGTLILAPNEKTGEKPDIAYVCRHKYIHIQIYIRAYAHMYTYADEYKNNNQDKIGLQISIHNEGLIMNKKSPRGEKSRETVLLQTFFFYIRRTLS